MKTRNLGIATVVLMSTWLYAACPPYYHSTPKSAPDFRYEKSGWVLKIWYVHKGSRSEGKFGVLMHNKKEVCPKRDGDIIDTPLGRLHFKAPKVPWGFRGWSFANGSKNPPPSWLLKAKTPTTPMDNRTKHKGLKSDKELWRDFQNSK